MCNSRATRSQITREGCHASWCLFVARSIDRRTQHAHARVQVVLSDNFACLCEPRTLSPLQTQSPSSNIHAPRTRTQGDGKSNAFQVGPNSTGRFDRGVVSNEGYVVYPRNSAKGRSCGGGAALESSMRFRFHIEVFMSQNHLPTCPSKVISAELAHGVKEITESRLRVQSTQAALKMQLGRIVDTMKAATARTEPVAWDDEGLSSSSSSDGGGGHWGGATTRRRGSDSDSSDYDGGAVDLFGASDSDSGSSFEELASAPLHRTPASRGVIGTGGATSTRFNTVPALRAPMLLWGVDVEMHVEDPGQAE